MKNIKKYAQFAVFLFITFATVSLEAAAADANLKIAAAVHEFREMGTQTDAYPPEQAKEIDALLRRISVLEIAKADEERAKKLTDLDDRVKKAEKELDNKQKKLNPGMLARALGYLPKLSIPDFIQNRSAQIELSLMAAHIAMWILNEPGSRLPIFSTLFSYTKNLPLSLIILANLVRCYNLRQKFNNDKLTFDDSMKNIGFIGGYVASLFLAYKGKNLTANYLGLAI